MPNRLAAESSPYLLQHADNPVDWRPWGPEAFAEARERDVPVLLSIGYAACHWCHVMAHESFEDDATAALMNACFVNVKVDREERPDVDAVYMQAVQAMTGHGGWPMTMFLTPEGKPFYGGTYYPPEDRHGMPSFQRVLRSVDEAWRQRRDGVLQGAESILRIYDDATSPARAGELTPATLDRATLGIATRYDGHHGGFGGAPKFPPTMTLDYLLRRWARTEEPEPLAMAHATWRHMADGGIHDQVGGGFARYAVDGIWLVPHFEKMLYDNALLARFGAHLWQATGDAEVRAVTERLLAWVEREMTDPLGGFYASLDADSEGEEGKFYLWDLDDLRAVLGADAPVAVAHWGVTQQGNFEGRNILHVAQPADAAAAQLGMSVAEVEGAIARARDALYAHRAARVWPGRDEKVLAGWNGLMLRGVATAARVFGDTRWLGLALRNGAFCRDHLVRDGRAWRSWARGTARIPGFLEDHAALGLGFLSLYEATFDRAWLDHARMMCDATVRWFWDAEANAFWDTAHDAERLVTRPRDVTDNAIPSGSALAAELCLHLGILLDDAPLRATGEAVLAAQAEGMARAPLAFGHLLGVADLAVHGAVEVALVGEPASPRLAALSGVVASRYVPSLVLAGGAGAGAAGIALLAHRAPGADGASAFVCRGYVCEAPADDAQALAVQLTSAPRR